MRFFYLLLFVGVLAKKRFDGHRVVSVFSKTIDDLNVLQALRIDDAFEELDFWTQPSLVRPTDIRVSPNDFGKLEDILKDAGIQFSITNENVQISVALEEEAMRRSKMASRNFYCDFFSTYCNLQEVEVVIDMLEQDFPNHVQVTSIGTTMERRDIFQVKVAQDLNNPKPAIFLEAGTHAREWITVSAALYMIHKLARAEDADSVMMLDKFDWYIIPVHNPDGYSYSHTTDRLWRKNRSKNGCNSVNTGVDLNRNWGAGFGATLENKDCCGQYRSRSDCTEGAVWSLIQPVRVFSQDWEGASANCRDNTYRGPYAFSEFETAALRDSLSKTENVSAFFAIHSYGEMIIIPYAYKTEKPANYDELYDVAQIMNAEIYATSRNNFLVGTAPDILYLASGGSDDYVLDSGVPFSYTFELAPKYQFQGGFELPPSQIPYAIEDLFVAMKAFAKQF